MRKVVAALCVAPLLASGCALVSGLSSLDVGETLDSGKDGTTIEAAVESGLDASIVDAPTDRDADAPPPVDAGKDADAAAACSVVGSDPLPFASVCTTANPIFQYTPIPAGTYELTSLREYLSTCNGYVPLQVTGVLNVVPSGPTYVLHERITINGTSTSRSYNANVSGTTMNVTVTCGPSITTTAWPLYINTQGGKTTISVLKPDFTVDQRFIWTQQ